MPIESQGVFYWSLSCKLCHIFSQIFVNNDFYVSIEGIEVQMDILNMVHFGIISHGKILHK